MNRMDYVPKKEEALDNLISDLRMFFFMSENNEDRM
jgi:hypothetical protein